MVDNVEQKGAEVAPEPEAPVEAAEAAEPAEAAATPPERPPRPRRVHVAIEDKATIADDVARRALTLMGVEVKEIEAKVDGEQVALKIGAITSPEGATLDGRAWESLQFLLNKAINRHAIKRTRLNLEADGFRARRSDGLDRMAASVARKVQQSGRAIAIGPVEPGELRQLASQFNRVSGVSVQTTGEPDRKLLVIAPGGGRGRRRRG
jgi:spoIIIJ-associated protein